MKRWMAIVAMAAILLWSLARRGFVASLADVATPVAIAVGVAVIATLVAAIALWRAHAATRQANRIGMLIHVAKADERPPGHPRTPMVRNAMIEAGGDTGPVEMLLQPIVSLFRNEAIGYDAVFADSVRAAPDSDRVRIATVVEAMALRPRDLGANGVVFVAVSAGFLAQETTRPYLAALVRGKPTVAAGLRLCVAETNGRPLLARELSGLAVPFAWCGPAMSIEPAVLAQSGATHWRIPAAALLHAQSARRLPALQAAETARANGIAVIATNVASREDAARLLELGIDLMVGPGIAPPLRLRGLESASPEAVCPGREAGSEPAAAAR